MFSKSNVVARNLTDGTFLTGLGTKFVWLEFILFQFYCLSTALGGQGRWDLSQAIATGDRLLGGGPLYSAGAIDGFVPSTPYFPGTSFFYYALIHVIPEAYAREVMLVLAVAIVTLYSWVLYRVFCHLGAKSSKGVFFLITFGLFATVFRLWIFYAVEWKPDTIALVLGTVAFLIAFQNPPRDVLLRSAAIALLVGIGVLFKQQFALFVVGLLAAILLCQRHLVARISYACAVVLGAGVSVAALVSTPSLVTFAIRAHEGRGFTEPFVLLLQHRNMIVFFVAVLLAAALAIGISVSNKGISFDRSRFMALGALRRSDLWSPIVPYLVCVTPWVFMQVLSAVNIGGNSGNTSAGLVPLVPIIIYILSRILPPVRMTVFGLMVCCMALPVMLASSVIGSNKTVTFYQNQATITAFLSKYHDANVLFTASSYMYLHSAGISHLSDLDTVALFGLGKLSSEQIPKFDKALKACKFDLIFSYPENPVGYSDGIPVLQNVDDYYAENRDVPPILKGYVWTPRRDVCDLHPKI